MPGYDFTTQPYRAQCIHVVDGDTVDLVVDMGFHCKLTGRFRVHGIDTMELHAHEPEIRVQAERARQLVTSWLMRQSQSEWPLRVQTYKDPDNFGRWLADVFFKDVNGAEWNLGVQLLELGLAVPFRRG